MSLLYISQTCPGRCEELTPVVQCAIFGSGPWDERTCLNNVNGMQERGELYIGPVDDHGDLESLIVGDTRLCTFIDDDDCRASFVYGYDKGRTVVTAQVKKDCPSRWAGA